jgi:selenocysteine lyase/cysteine desulfurase
MRHFSENIGAPARGAYAEAREAAGIVRTCRERIRRLINGEKPEHVVFGYNASDALNLAIKGMVRGEARTRPLRDLCVITSTVEHNSVLRPLSALRDDGLHVMRVRCDPRTLLVSPADIDRAISDARAKGLHVALVALNHASNVTGVIQPVAHVGRLCAEAGVRFLVDASQSLGHIPVDVRAMHIDLLAFPGHKGLLGPQGTGALYIRPGVERELATIREGGTGSISDLDVMPDVMPDTYEPGSHNALGIAGLSEGVRWLLDRGVDAVAAHERAVAQAFLAAIESADAPAAGLRLLGSTSVPHVGVFSFVHSSIDPAELGTLLETEYGVLTRAGLHCAPLVHQTLGTTNGGAVRFSLGPYISAADATFAAGALCELARAEHRVSMS